MEILQSNVSASDSVEAPSAVGTAGLAIGFVCMFVTASGIFIHALRQHGSKIFSAVSFLVCIIAATSYLSMAAGASMYASSVGSSKGRIIFWARYADWLFTTPLLLIDLGLLAGLTVSEIAMACGWDVMMVVLGLAGAMQVTNDAGKWLTWLVADIAMVVIFYMLAGIGRKRVDELKTETYKNRYNLLMLMTVILWTAYPAVWAAAEGTGAIGPDIEIWLYMLLDITAKCVFSILLLTVRPEESSADTPLAYQQGV